MFYVRLKGLFSAMPFHLLLVCLLDFLSEVTTKPLAPELYVSSTAGTSLNNRPLVGRSPQQYDLFSEVSNTGDTSVFVDNLDLFSSTPRVSGNDVAFLDTEVYPLYQNNPSLDIHYEITEGQAVQDPDNLDLFVESIGETAELPPLCEGGDNFDSFIEIPSVLTGRNLIDDLFDFRIPEQILTPNQLCPNPQDTRKSAPQSTEDTSRLPFRVPLPDLAGKICRYELGEGPLYALCCFMEADGNRENACYPGRVFLLLLLLLCPYFLFPAWSYNFPRPMIRVPQFHKRWPSIIRWPRAIWFFSPLLDFMASL